MKLILPDEFQGVAITPDEFQKRVEKGLHILRVKYDLSFMPEGERPILALLILLKEAKAE